ncbi:unnamed protein product, partial [Durusdinium trenchii]
TPSRKLMASLQGCPRRWLAERRMRGCRKVRRRPCRNDAGACLLASLQTLLSKGRFQQWQSYGRPPKRKRCMATLWFGTMWGSFGIQLRKCRKSWLRGTDLKPWGASTLITSPRFPLEHFDVPPRVLQWKETQSLTHTLILRGPPGTGKTEMAISVLLSTCRAGIHFVSKLDQMHKITVHPGEGLVVDEACSRTVSIDDAKAWCDVTHARDVHNRCSDGHIPAQTPRIFTTNHEVPQFWPPEYFHSSHQAAIDRRTVWVDCPNKLFKDREATCKGNNVTLRSAIQGRCIAPQKCVTQVVSEVH